MLNPARRENDQKIEAAEVENAAPGSAVGELTGDIAAERTSIIWPRSGVHSSISNGAYHEEDACDLSSGRCRHP
jgi:hypothetical protein